MKIIVYFWSLFFLSVALYCVPAHSGELIKINDKEYSRSDLFNLGEIKNECKRKNREIMKSVSKQGEWETKEEYKNRMAEARKLLSVCDQLSFDGRNNKIEYTAWGGAHVSQVNTNLILIKFPFGKFWGPFASEQVTDKRKFYSREKLQYHNSSLVKKQYIRNTGKKVIITFNQTSYASSDYHGFLFLHIVLIPQEA